MPLGNPPLPPNLPEQDTGTPAPSPAPAPEYSYEDKLRTLFPVPPPDPFPIPLPPLTNAQFSGLPNDPLTNYLFSQYGSLQQAGIDAGTDQSLATQLADQLHQTGVGQLEQQAALDRWRLENRRYRNQLDLTGLDQQLASNVQGQAASLGDIARQLGLAGEAFGLAGRTAASDLNLAGNVRDTAYDRYARGTDILGRTLRGDISRSNQLTDFAEADFMTRRDENALTNRVASRAARGDATRRGATLSAGYRDTRADLGDQLRLADQGAQQIYNRELGSIDDQTRNAQLAFDRGTSDARFAFDAAGNVYDRAAAGAQQSLDAADIAYRGKVGDLDYQRDVRTRQFEDAQRGIENERKMLESVASDFDIDAQQLENTLKAGIDTLGIDFNQTMQQIATAHASGDATRRAQANSIITSLLEAAMNASAAPVGFPATNPTPVTPTGMPHVPAGIGGGGGGFIGSGGGGLNFLM
jgi:hypothetical protein